MNRTAKISLFNFLILTFLFAGVIVFLVNNIIAVNRLAELNNEIRNQLNKTISFNNTLMTEIERLSAYNVIRPVASDKLKLNSPVSKPKKIVIPKSHLND
jgi:cell division protein FtsL